jgi:hypothetical protein
MESIYGTCFLRDGRGKVARPARLIDGPRTERYREEDGHLPRRGFSTFRADLAHFLLREAEVTITFAQGHGCAPMKPRGEAWQKAE